MMREQVAEAIGPGNNRGGDASGLPILQTVESTGLPAIQESLRQSAGPASFRSGLNTVSGLEFHFQSPRRAAMHNAEQYDAVVLRSGAGGKDQPWPLAQAGTKHHAMQPQWVGAPGPHTNYL